MGCVWCKSVWCQCGHRIYLWVPCSSRLFIRLLPTPLIKSYLASCIVWRIHHYKRCTLPNAYITILGSLFSFIFLMYTTNTYISKQSAKGMAVWVQSAHKSCRLSEFALVMPLQWVAPHSLTHMPAQSPLERLHGVYVLTTMILPCNICWWSATHFSIISSTSSGIFLSVSWSGSARSRQKGEHCELCYSINGWLMFNIFLVRSWTKFSR